MHVVYYDPDKESLLLDGIAPALAAVRDAGLPVDRAYVRRHWLLGPHVRLNVEAEEAVFASAVEPRLRADLERYVRLRPSRVDLDPDDYALRSARYGQAELVPGPYLPLRPDNVVVKTAYDPRAEVVGGAEMVAEMETYLSGVQPLVLDLLAATRGNSARRLSRICACMATLACLYPEQGLRYGHLSFRSHAEAFLAGNPPGVRARFERVRDRNIPELTAQLARVVADSGGGVSPSADLQLERWRTFHATCQQRYLTLATADRIPDHWAAARAYAARAGRFEYFEDGPGRPQSEFHRVVTGPAQAMYDAPAFHAYRLLLNFFYLNLPALNVDSSTKFLLCYLVAEASERVLGETWQQILER